MTETSLLEKQNGDEATAQILLLFLPMQKLLTTFAMNVWICFHRLIIFATLEVIPLGLLVLIISNFLLSNFPAASDSIDFPLPEPKVFCVPQRR